MPNLNTEIFIYKLCKVNTNGLCLIQIFKINTTELELSKLYY